MAVLRVAGRKVLDSRLRRNDGFDGRVVFLIGGRACMFGKESPWYQSAGEMMPFRKCLTFIALVLSDRKVTPDMI